VTRRLTLLVLVAVLATAGTGALLIARERARIEPEVTPPAESGLALVVVRTEHGPLPAVVGTTGFGTTGALVISPRTLLVVPGQGESTVGDALELPPREAATAVGNLLGVWIENHATIDTGRLEAIANETDGVEIGGDAANGQDVADMLAEPGAGGVSGLQVVLEALMSADAAWAPTDLAEAERPGTVVRALSAAAGSNVATLLADEVASGVFRASPEQVTEALVEAFGGPATEAVPVIVLNGNGVPGIGEAVAERIIPGGSVSVGSGIAPVTIVVGKDFTG